ncbi:hypothetical protein OSC27_13965 [Microbacterium sp. STN6]|uniref:hypothetical protein n=1 Tax=Microbacterium sp. STN6 TaxID=2995588 RepID=UPI002260AF62|nr:hypothetical protein [Microbacterium sp. STN6]MCX7523379.1 hypothetical protein [Microbacterium sp. STN6]
MTETQIATLTPARRWASIVLIWVLAALAAVAIGLFSPTEDDTTWLGLALAGSMVCAMCVQLATQQKQGFVGRLVGSVSGAVVVLAVAAAVLALVAAR